MNAVLVTGAAGFIGSHVCDALIARGERVVGIDNFDTTLTPMAAKRRNLAEVLDGAPLGRFRLVEADVTHADAMRAIFEREGPERVIHLAARAGVTPSLKDPVGYTRVNVLGTSIVMDLARRHGCRSFVMASSSSVYGDRPGGAGSTPFREDDACDSPISPYAATKRACELLSSAEASASGGMGVACLRFFTVFGPRQRPDLAIARFMSRLREGEAIERRGDGSSSRDYTFVSDIVSGVLAALARAPEHGFRVWNLGHDEPVTLNELIRVLGEVTGIEARVREVSRAAGDVERTHADLTRSRAELGYEPRTTLREGLERQWRWFSDVGSAPG